MIKIAYIRPIRLDELVDWLLANDVPDAEALAKKMYDHFEEILVLSKTAQ